MLLASELRDIKKMCCHHEIILVLLASHDISWSDIQTQLPKSGHALKSN